MKVAIIGTGIAGLTAAHRLRETCDLTVFEANDYVGGHTNTVTVDDHGSAIPVDTGFIVYNAWTYPNFCKLLDELGVATQVGDMSFSVADQRTQLEYCGNNLNTLFAQRRNLVRPGFWRILYDLIRFYRQSRKLLAAREPELTLGDYLREHRYSREFIEQHLIPMGAAIWSADPAQFSAFPARYFARFCFNHGMLNIFRRPTWRTITNGSREYVKRIVAKLEGRIALRTPIERIARYPAHVEVTTADGARHRFDRVVIATHSDQALRMLADASSTERALLSAIPYQRNEAVLHTDTSILPRERRAWASWNYHIPRETQRHATLTYNMNLLQSLPARETYCVTLNPATALDPARVIRSFEYDHPVYTVDGIRAQRRVHEISGVNRTHYCGAYWGFGFHEDGVKSGLRVVDEVVAVRRAARLDGPASPLESSVAPPERVAS